MRDQVLWRKVGRIVTALSDRLEISPEWALDLFYNSRTAQLLFNPETGLQLLSDEYTINDLITELQQTQ